MRKRNSILKHVLSLILSIVMTVSLITIPGPKQVEAASDPLEVSFDFKEVSSNKISWLFNYSALPAEYVGDSSTWKTVNYQFDAYKDGSTKSEKVRIEFVGELAYIWGEKHYVDQVMPTTSLYVPAGTVLSECTYSESSHTTSLVSNGKSLVLTQDLDVIYLNGEWVNNAAKRITLNFRELNESGQWLFDHTALPESYQGTDNWDKTVRYAVTIYKNGYSEEVAAWVEFVGSTMYIYPHGFLGQTAPTTALYIPSGTILSECTYDDSAQKITLVSGGKSLMLTEDLDLVYRNGVWNKTNQAEVSFSFRGKEGSNWLLNHSQLPTEFQGTDNDWDNTIRYMFKAYRDDSTALRSGFLEFVGSTAYLYPDSFPGGKAPTSRLYIPEGTVLYECDYLNDQYKVTPTPNGKTLVVTEELDLVYQNGTWQKNPSKEITLRFDGIDEYAHWNFDHTKLTKKYQGTDWDDAVKYQFQAYKDGSSTLQTGWLEFVGDTAKIYAGSFPGEKIPNTGLHIPKGTLLQEYDAKENKLVTNGRCLKLVEDCILVPDNGQWYQQRLADSQYDFVSSQKSSYQILVPAKPTDKETFAAEELQYFVKEATGVNLPIFKEGSGTTPSKYISVGNTNASQNAGVNPTYEQLNTSGLVIKTIGDDCYIKGYSDIGTRNGVYTWLEYTFDYVCYSAKEIVVTERTNRKLPAFDMTYVPSFEFRQDTGEVGVLDWENAYRYRYTTPEEVYVTTSNSMFHNGYSIINPEGAYDYKDDKYRDWYSPAMHENIQHGLRMLPAQFCYSNEEMRSEYLKNLKTILTRYNQPTMMIGMEDNPLWCTCTECTASLNKYGTNAAVMIKFLNYLQEEINAWCVEQSRDKVSLIMFAYHACEEPPVKWDGAKYSYVPVDSSVKLHKDSGVMYAPVNASYTYSFNDAINTEFKHKLKGWGTLTNNIYAWTYSVYPADLFIFYDSFDIMKENYQFLLDHGTKSMFDQLGNINVNGNSGWEMAKTYVMAELQWDMSQDIDQLLQDFFENYFQDASDIMLDLMEYNSTFMKENLYPKMLYAQPTEENYKSVEGNIFVEIMDNPTYYSCFTEEYVNEALSRIDQAFAAIEKYKYTDPERYEKLYERILLEKMQFSYLDACLFQGDGRWGRTITEDRWQFRVDFERVGLTTVREAWDAEDQFNVIWDVSTYNSVKISFAEILSTGQIYLKGTITAGPDKGKTIAQVYGDGETASGEMSYLMNELMIKDIVTWNTSNTNSSHGDASLCLESKHIKDNISKINEFVIEEGTKVMLGAKTPMQIVNDVHLVKIANEKYIDVSMLDIMVQDNYDAVATGTKKYNMRFISSVNSLEYAKAGFVFSLANDNPQKGESNCAFREVTKVYENIQGGLNATNYHVSQLYGDYSKYMYAFEINGVPASKKIYVRGYVQLDDGTVIYGEVREITAPKAK